MKILKDGLEREIPRIKHSRIKALLRSKANILVLGKSGWGKSQAIEEYCEENGLKLKVISLASWLPEMTGGIPKSTDGKYFELQLWEELRKVFEDDGEGWVIFFDEINQAVAEVLNTLYGICYTFGKGRYWCGHSLSKAQIVACGNLDDGTDGVTYLTPLPTPLVNRFKVYELECSKKEAKDFLKKKYRNIPQVVKYIDTILDNGYSPRTTELCLDTIAYAIEDDVPELLNGDLMNESLVIKLMDIQKKVKTADPAKTLKLCKQSYEIFKEDGIVQWAGEEIETEEELLEKFAEILSEEEIKAIVKGEE